MNHHTPCWRPSSNALQAAQAPIYRHSLDTLPCINAGFLEIDVQMAVGALGAHDLLGRDGVCELGRHAHLGLLSSFLTTKKSTPSFRPNSTLTRRRCRPENPNTQGRTLKFVINEIFGLGKEQPRLKVQIGCVDPEATYNGWANRAGNVQGSDMYCVAMNNEYRHRMVMCHLYQANKPGYVQMSLYKQTKDSV